MLNFPKTEQEKVYYLKSNIWFLSFFYSKKKKAMRLSKFENAVNMQISLQMLQHKSGGALNSMKGDPWY